MWFLLAFFIAGFVLTAFISPKIKIENAKAAGLDDFNFPRSNEGDPTPRFYGTVKHEGPNTIGLTDYVPVPIKKKVKTGLFSSKKVITGYKNYIGLDLAWGLGPGVVYRRLWFGENLVWAGCLYDTGCVNSIIIDLPELYGGSKDGNRGGIGGKVTMYCGAFDQSRDPYLALKLDPNVPAYVGIAHMVFSSVDGLSGFWFGNANNVDAIACEASYFSNSLGQIDIYRYMPNGLDANPVEVLHDILVDGWGNLGYDPTKINTANWILKAEQIRDEGNGISISIANATEAKDVVKQILRQINGLIYEDQTTGLVELDLIRDDYDVGDLDVLGPSQIVEIRNYSKKLWNETNNVVRVKYTDREAGYIKDKVAIAKDFALLRFQGKQRPVEITMPGVYEAGLANQIAARELSNLNVPLFQCEMVLNRTVSSLKPGSVFILEWPEWGITQMVMRVRKVGKGELRDGKITISVVQDEFSLKDTVISAPVPPIYIPTSYEPADIETFDFMEVPAFLDYQAGLGTRVGYTRLMSFAKSPTSYSIGYDGFIEEGDEDAQILTVAPYSFNAKLDNPISRFDGFADGVIPVVVIKELNNPTILQVAPDVRLGGGLFAIGDELFAYETFVDNLDGTYDLIDVHRAFLDSGWFAHIDEAPVYFFDGQEGFFETDSLPGVAIDVYLTDRTATGSSAVDSAVVSPLTPVGRVEAPVAPDYVTADASRAANQVFLSGDIVSIDARARTRLELTQAWFEDDAAATPEPGTLYTIKTETGGVETLVADDETLPYNLTTTTGMVGQTIVHVYAKRGSVNSIASGPIPIVVVLPETVLIDGVPVLIDGDTIEIS
jgi:Putative phage tail protein